MKQTKTQKPAKPEPVEAPELIRPSEGPGGVPSGRDAHVIKPPKTEGQPFPGVHVT